jgi:hypothetical protein
MNGRCIEIGRYHLASPTQRYDYQVNIDLVFSLGGKGNHAEKLFQNCVQEPMAEAGL